MVKTVTVDLSIYIVNLGGGGNFVSWSIAEILNLSIPCLLKMK